MNRFNEEIQAAHKIIMRAIKCKTSCIVEMKNGGVSLSPYEDKIGIYGILSLYMSNYANINGKTGLSITSKAGESFGSCFINWDEVKSVIISRHYERIHLTIGSLSINFTEEIK